MNIDDAPRQHRRVAVAGSREAAAASFGRGDDDLYVTTYADIDGEVDLAALTALDLVIDGDHHATLERVCTLVANGAPRVRVAVTPEATDGLAQLLDRAGIRVVEPQREGATVLLRLVPAATDGAAPADVVLAALEAARVPPAELTVRPTAGVPAGTTRRPRPVPRLLRTLEDVDRWRRSPRRRALLAGVLLTAVLVLLLIGLLPSSTQLLESIAVPLLLVTVLGCAAASIHTSLLLARQVHRQTGRLEQMALRNREVLEKRTHGLRHRLTAIERGQARLPFLEQYVEAVAEHGAATSARLRDLLEILEVDQRVEDARHEDATRG